MNCSILEFQVSVKASRGSLAIGLLLLAGLCVLAYGPSLSIPLIEDDYPNLWESHTYGPAAALSWIGIALIPYSFLTYSRQIPSRQTYLASFGLALLVGLVLAHLAAGGLGAGKFPRAAAMVAVVVLLGNIGYLWTRKRAQFLARAGLLLPGALTRGAIYRPLPGA